MVSLATPDKSTGVLSRIRLFVTRGKFFKILSGSLYFRSRRVTELMLSKHPTLRKLGGDAWVCPSWGARRPNENVLGAVLVNGFGRFGNSIIQLLNCQALASELNIQRVFFHRFDLVGNRDIALGNGIQLVKTTPLKRNHKMPPVLWATHAIRGTDLIADPCSPQSSETRRIVSGHILPGGPGRSTAEGTLTVHIRSGDIFGENPHPNYGQPPLAFYQQVIESGNWASVIIVSEDAANPCVTALTQWCRERRIPTHLQNAGLAETVEVIARSGAIVAGRGTFVPAIVSLFPRQRDLFFFEMEPPPLLLCDRENNIRIGQDALGEYRRDILSGNWASSAAQKALMVSYELSALAPLRTATVEPQ